MSSRPSPTAFPVGPSRQPDGSHRPPQEVEPLVPWVQTCNPLYPRTVLQAVGGCAATLPLAAGENTDLALRARRAGTGYVGEPAVLTHHAVEDATLRARVREVGRRQHLPFVTRRHPEVAGGGYPWKPTHARVPFLLAGLALTARRRPLLDALVSSSPSYASSPRGRLRALPERPAHAMIDPAEVARRPGAPFATAGCSCDARRAGRLMRVALRNPVFLPEVRTSGFTRAFTAEASRRRGVRAEGRAGLERGRPVRC